MMFGLDLHAMAVSYGLIAGVGLCLAGAALAFVNVPIFGRWIAAGLVALAAGLGAYDMGYRARGAHDESVALRGQVAELQRQAAETSRIAAAAAEREQMLFDAVGKQQEKIDAYDAELSRRPRGACALGADDVRRLRDIAGSSNPPQPPRRPSDLRPPGSGAESRAGR